MAARLDLTVFRRDPMHAIVRVAGVDLTGVPMRYAVGPYPNAPVKFLALGPVQAVGAEGVRFVQVETDGDGLPVSVFELIAAKASMIRFPVTGEIGGGDEFAHDLQVDRLPIGDGFTSVETTLLFGTLTIKGSVND